MRRTEVVLKLQLFFGQVPCRSMFFPLSFLSQALVDGTPFAFNAAHNFTPFVPFPSETRLPISL